MNDLSELEHELSAWPSISIHAHRFGGKEFRFGSAEVGHIHRRGTVDIPFPRPVHDVLLANGLAEEHRWVPNSGWVTFPCAGIRTSNMRCGSCGCRTCATRSKPRAIHTGYYERKASACI